MKTIPVFILLLVTLIPMVRAQEETNQTQEQQALRVFVDCRTRHCDFDYFRTEINFVDYVRDPEDSDVHVLVTTQQTGGGGTEFTLNFIGLKAYESVNDTLTTSSRQTDTDDEVRSRLASILKVGFMRYVGRTPWFDRISISYGTRRRQQVSTQPKDDPWNFWVFRTRLSGNGFGEDRFKSINSSGSFTASRTTEELKVIFSAIGSRRAQTFTYGDGSQEKDVQENYGFSGLVVWSLGEHWSTGFRTSADRSTRSNYDAAIDFAPAIEYDIFPYSESTRKQFTFQYAMGVNYFNYSDSTIFNKMEETLLQQSLEVSLNINQPWGEVETSIEGANYMHDFEKFSLELSGDIDVRIFRGLSFNIGGTVSLVRDQLNIAMGDASNEDVLLRRRELETDWRYFTRFGISYTFGSIFNNVVNPRFGGERRGGGDRMFFF